MKKNVFSVLVILVMLAGLVFQVTPARASTLAEIQTSIDNGLAYLAGTQNVDGSWTSTYTVGTTCAVVAKFQDRAYEKGYASPFDPAYTYSDEIIKAYTYIFANTGKQTLAVQPAGNPDTNGNGYGVWFATAASSPGYNEVNYETALCLMAMTSSKLPGHLNEGGLDYDGDLTADTFQELTQEGVDFLAWAQNDTGVNRGGWRYGFNPQDADGSVSGFATLGLAYAESWGATIPAFVKSELNNWITYAQCADGGAAYTACPGSNMYRTGHLITMMAFVGDTPATPRMDNALKYIEANWALPLPEGTGFLGTWSLMKGLSYSGVHLLDLDGDTVRDDDWFNADPTTGKDLATYTIGLQQPDGGWGSATFFEGSPDLKAAFALLVLEKASPPPPNAPPVAVNDTYSTHHGTTLTVPALTGVLANDTDADSDPLTAIKVTDPASGTLSAFGTDGSFTYIPQAGFVGDVTFTYKANDGAADSNIATVTIQVTNTVPVAVNESYTATMSVAFTGATVLGNDSDADLDTLTAAVVTPPAHDSAFTFNANGTFTYEPENGFRGTDTFTYMANDGAQNSNVATVSIQVNPLVATFQSISEYDGWMLESSKGSKLGGNVWANQILRLGDSAFDQQYRSMLSFNASSMDNASVIVGAWVRMHQYDVKGTDPRTTHGNIITDVRKGAFGGSTTLVPSDWEATATKLNIGRFVLETGSLKWYRLTLAAVDLKYINPSGITQFRVRFSIGTDADKTEDIVRFASGNSVKTGRPMLVVEYYIPHP